MITAKLKTILNDSGCTLVIYEQEQLANLYTDRSDATDVVGIIFRSPDVMLEVRANAIHEHYPPVKIEVLQQVKLEEKAEGNEAQLQTLLNICKEIIIRLIATGEFKKITPIRVTRVLETRYDANLIGWSLPIDLYYLLNENREPCL